MAQRYGGAHSPDAHQSPPPPRGEFTGAKRTRVGGRINLLFFVPLPLALKAFRADPSQMALYLGALGLLLLSAWLTRSGLAAQEAYEARKIARRPAIPRKIFGTITMGLGAALAGMAGFGAMDAAIFAVIGAGLHLAAFGIDPLKNKGMEGIDTYQSDRVARAIESAESELGLMRDAIMRAADRGLESRVAQFQTIARDLFRTIEDDPRDLTAARKYLGIYLKGAREATEKFVEIYARNRDSGARADFETLLGDLETNFAARTEKLLSDDHSDLTIEIEVLRERLQRDGVAMRRSNQ